MNLKYVDVYYMHWPLMDMDPDGKLFIHRPLEEIWKDFEECVRKGYTKHIAVSNFNGQLLADLLTFCKIKPIINQIEVHPYFQQPSLV
jgi:aldehyde reductase